MAAKRTISLVLLVGFVSIAVFGFAGMISDGDHAHKNCLAATARAVDCPVQSDKLLSLWFHLDAFKQFSRATFVGLILPLLLVAGFALALARLSIGNIPARTSDPLFALERRKNFISPLKNQYSSWLALHLHSPSFSYAGA